MSDTMLRDRLAADSSLAESVLPLSVYEAGVEANRCLYCYDAPCLQACPTHIDIPAFIRKIAQGRPRDAARTILSDNLLGATCSRVCPVQELCEGACVLTTSGKPIAIGRLQRFATDTVLRDPRPLFTPVAPTGFRVAVVGSGPAGLSCAGELVRRGHTVEVFEKRELPGGLSTYGIVTLREPVDVALAEVEFLRRLGVVVRSGRELGVNLDWDELDRFDAVFLAMGLGRVPLLGIPGDEAAVDGLELIEAAKVNPGSLGVGKNVVVVGAGNTAIDCATVARRLGAQDVTILYRRTSAEMTAYPHEFEFAKKEGIRFCFLTGPTEVVLEDGRVIGLLCQKMELGDEDLSGRRSVRPVPESGFFIETDQVISAIGQLRPEGSSVEGLAREKGYLAVDEQFRTNRKKVFAGGDCVRSTGEASTVMAVQDGKLAARSLHSFLVQEARRG